MTTARPTRFRAFSLIELIAVVAIIGAMALILIPRASAARDKSAQNACYHNRAMLNSAVERFTMTTGAAPTALSDLNVPDYFPDGIPVCPVSGNAYTLDVPTQRIIGHSAGSHP